MKALLFSGGIDSTALAWGLRPSRLLFIDYGQRPVAGERRAARAVSAEIGLILDEVYVDLSLLGSGSMVGGPALPGAPPEHWPYRNQVLLTIAAMRYAQLPLEALIIGSVLGDEQHSDGTSDFRTAFGRLLEVQAGPRLEAPAAHYATEDLIAFYGLPERVLRWTFSCHTGEWACGACRGCHKHHRVIAQLEAKSN